MNESAEDQVRRLAEVIMDEIPGEPSQSQGAVDTAIRLLRAAYVPNEDGATAMFPWTNVR